MCVRTCVYSMLGVWDDAAVADAIPRLALSTFDAVDGRVQAQAGKGG